MGWENILYRLSLFELKNPLWNVEWLESNIEEQVKETCNDHRDRL